ncbi:hypothetical protein PHYBOEH_011037 [Phytophthora boehmeriae]|uniref:Uncharacterized protein n=1 Tax=Phytophthora boehmeriae TaxID=109152 RepID=A0A8T1XBS9_9STRA|nr:hypothetical protein PHYBOEH_011037 [Phytophthora boehmeriae]
MDVPLGDVNPDPTVAKLDDELALLELKLDVVITLLLVAAALIADVALRVRFRLLKPQFVVKSGRECSVSNVGDGKPTAPYGAKKLKLLLTRGRLLAAAVVAGASP